MNYPKYVQVAADWWTDKIQGPSHDFGGTKEQENLVMLFSIISQRNFSDEELITFNQILANNINNEIEKYGDTTIYVDYDPQTQNLKQL